MQTNSLPRSFTVVFGGVCFFLSALLMIVSLFGPPLAGDIAFLDWVLERPGYTLFFTYMVLGFSLFNVPALLGATHLVKGRGEKLIYFGSITALIGNFFFTILVTEALIQRGMATLEREPMVALLQWIFETPVYIVPHMLFFLLFYVGLLLLTIGLFRARVASKWLIVAGVVQLFAGFLEFGPAQAYVQSAVTLALFGGIGWVLIRKPEEGDTMVTVQKSI
ncbi:hypothetical protein SAMN05877753_104307 [Bacillus oleivorans]|uniref:Uncharacterized protein n=1 Tax=Bacillus oleivorans TaxID=1448271 RepID=A0A285CUL3_9BACI|nr:hypothetical protein [Bacillus oleivorans]SNX70738.1 hypothetical protein SAMN05877753_104307 [Bacillus oleivorans]